MELGSERRTKGIKCVFVTCKVEGTGGLVKRRSTVEETEVKKRALGKILNQYSKHYSYFHLNKTVLLRSV